MQRAVAEGTLKAESYTEGQVGAIKAQAASRFVRSHAAAAAPEEPSRSTSGIKRSRAHVDGHAAQVVNAVKTRRIDSGGRKRVVTSAGTSRSSESGSGDDEERVEVEVDLCKLLGIREQDELV